MPSLSATPLVPKALKEDFQLCRKITLRRGRNFSIGFRVLPPKKRWAIYAAYAFCRIADDFADEGERSLKALDRWEAELEATYQGKPSHPVGRALAQTLTFFPIPKESFLKLIEGCRLDFSHHYYKTFDELYHYCDLVAAPISHIALSVFRYTHPDALTKGHALAYAFQLTNVLRDLWEDRLRDRCYLPEEHLQKFGLSFHSLFDPAKRDQAFACIIAFGELAESYYRQAKGIEASINKDARGCVNFMKGVYEAILHRIIKKPWYPLKKRTTLSKMQKLYYGFQVTLQSMKHWLKIKA